MSSRSKLSLLVRGGRRDERADRRRPECDEVAAVVRDVQRLDWPAPRDIQERDRAVPQLPSRHETPKKRRTRPTFITRPTAPATLGQTVPRRGSVSRHRSRCRTDASVPNGSSLTLARDEEQTPGGSRSEAAAAPASMKSSGEALTARIHAKGQRDWSGLAADAMDNEAITVPAGLGDEGATGEGAECQECGNIQRRIPIASARSLGSLRLLLSNARRPCARALLLVHLATVRAVRRAPAPASLRQATVLELPPIGGSRAPASCLCTERNGPGQVASVGRPERLSLVPEPRCSLARKWSTLGGPCVALLRCATQAVAAVPPAGWGAAQPPGVSL